MRMLSGSRRPGDVASDRPPLHYIIYRKLEQTSLTSLAALPFQISLYSNKLILNYEIRANIKDVGKREEGGGKMPIDMKQFETGITMKPDEVFTRKGTGKKYKPKGDGFRDTCPWCDRLVVGRNMHLTESCEHEFMRYISGRPLDDITMEKITRNWNEDGSAKWRMNSDAKRKCEMCQEVSVIEVDDNGSKRILCMTHAYRLRFNMKHKDVLEQVQRVRVVETIRFAKTEKERKVEESLEPRWKKMTKEEALQELKSWHDYRKIIMMSLIGRERVAALKDWSKAIKRWVRRSMSKGATKEEVRAVVRWQ